MVGIASKRRLRTAAILVGAAILAVSCAPIIAPDSQPLNRLTPTDVPPTRTASRTPEPTKTPGPTKTPEPTKELRPGIDTWVELGGNLSLQFKQIKIISDYNNPEIYDEEWKVHPGVGQTWLVIEGTYKGDISSVLGGANLNLLQKGRPHPFYAESPNETNIGLFGAEWSGSPKNRFAMLFFISIGDKGPFKLNDLFDKEHGWVVDLKSLPPIITP